MNTLTNWIIGIAAFMSFSACSNNNGTIREAAIEPKNDSLESTNVELAEPEIVESEVAEHDKHLLIYEYNDVFLDSTLICEMWYLNDSLLLKEGKFYYHLPIYSDFMTVNFMKRVNGQEHYESFDSMVCETGGRSAWKITQVISYI